MKKFFKWVGIIIGSLIALLLLIMFIQWLFFSYNDNDFNIPENYFDRMYEYEEIDSEENGLTEYIAYSYGITENINLNGTESQEKFDNEIKNLTKLKEPETNNYYEHKFDCIYKNSCKELDNNIINDKYLYYNYNKKEIDLKDLDYNGEKFNEMVNYFEEKYKLFEKIKDKKYIKYNDDIILYLPSISSEFKRMSGIILVYIENQEYEKGIDLLIKQREIIDTIDKKMNINDIIFVVGELSRSSTNYSTIEYILNNYQNIPTNLLEKLLTELKNPIREGIVKDGMKSEYRKKEKTLSNKSEINKSLKLGCGGNGIDYYNYYISYDDVYLEKTFKNIGCYGLQKILFTLFYSKNETLSLLKKVRYDFIELANDEEFWKQDGITQTIAESYIFAFKNISNFYGRILTRVALISTQGYQYDEELTYIQRQSLIQTLQEKIPLQKEKEAETITNKADILKTLLSR